MSNSRVRQIAEDQGWDDATLLDYALDYLAEIGDVDGFVDFIDGEAKADNARAAAPRLLKKPARQQYPDTLHDAVLPLPQTEASGRRLKK